MQTKFAYNRLMQYEYVFHEAWDMIVLLLTYYHVFYSPFYSFLNDSWSTRLQRLKKAAHVEHFFLFYLLSLHKKEKLKKKRKKTFYKKCSHNGSYSMNIHRLFNLFTDFFHALFYLSRQFFFWPEIANISFSAIARCSSKEK